ncbi:MAG TPA: GNAT family N-acetyltransferase [Gaiellaceae bacterium]
MAHESLVRDVILREGRTLRLRPPTAADADSVLALFERLSERSLYFRFHGHPRVNPALVAPFLEPDWADRGSLVGVVENEGVERVLAIASWARLRDRRRAEVAFAVDDRYQGKGIGTRLLEQLADLAAERGIEAFVAEVLAENRPMLDVFAGAGFDVARSLSAGVVEVSFPIAATETYRGRVDERDHEAVVASLQPFFQPESVAVLGASPRAGSIGGTVTRNIVTGAFPGRLYAVNRSGEQVAGAPGYRAVAELPEVVDLAVVCLPAEFVADAAQAVLAQGTRALCVISAGFAEAGPEGAERERRLLTAVRAYSARLLGPNCLGVSVAASHLNATFAPRAFPAGPIGFASQSGALGLALLERANERALGFSAFVSTGNKADVSSNDLLEYWEDDPATELVLLYLESFGNPRKFGRLARRVSGRKPVLAMKSGVSRAGARAALSHTAALAGSEAAVDALFHQAGVIRSASLEELLDVASLLSHEPLPPGRQVAVLTNAGGLGILCADACEAAGLELSTLGPETGEALRRLLPPAASVANPVDMLGSATPSLYESALPILLVDPAVDAVIVIFVPAATVTAQDVAAAVERATAGRAKPVARVSLAEESPPGSFPYPESAARALARAAERAEWLRRPLGSVPTLYDIDADRAREIVEAVLVASEDAWLAPTEVRCLLAAYGLPLVAERVGATAADAVAAARELGYPVAVKTAAPGVHKTERGGVALDVSDDEAVTAAAQRIGAPVVVQAMARGDAELLAGVVQDPVFGPLVGFGPGGVLAELIGEVVFRIAPLADVDAAELVSSGKAGRLVRGFRGKPALDADALTTVLHRLSRLAVDLPEVVELDVNPLIARADGCIAVDARVRVRRPERPVRVKTW